MGYVMDSKVIDLTNLEVCCFQLYVMLFRLMTIFFKQLEMGKMMEQGPVLIITFQTQQIMTIRDAKGKVVEGDPVRFLISNG